MLTIPVSVALIRAGVIPDGVSLLPLGLGLTLCVAHSVIGFGVGLKTPRAISAPLMAVAVWVLSAFPQAIEPFWLRHISGSFAEQLMFGEAASFKILLPHLLPTGAMAVGVALLWLGSVPLLARLTLSIAVALGGFISAYHLTNNWGPTPPLVIGNVAMKCSGQKPRVCMPAVTASSLPQAVRDVDSVLNDLRAVGVSKMPDLITDRIVDGRYSRSSTDQVWRVGLTRAAADDSLRYRVGFAAARFDCMQPDLATSRAVRLWMALSIGEGAAERQRVAEEVTPFDGQAAVETEVAKIRKMDPVQQGDWFRSQLVAACVKTN
ncbi:hypothetical protein ACGFY7_33450 [Streptomyces prunicolor]|uniref:DUF7224 domain-containing protein n=1 Tax=Streptomyces prunicolor TaxID=67348 RepID=UPI00371B0694